MNIHFKQSSVELSEKLIAKTQLQLTKVSRFIRESQYEPQVYVVVERESGSKNSESLWRSSINVDVAGDRYNASEVGNTPEKAVNLTVKELKRELRTSAKKKYTQQKQGGLMLKRLRQNFA